MDALVAIIGLVGTVAASAAVADWLKRRNRREVIKTDLDVWHRLPEGPAKERLKSRIEKRVDDLGVVTSDTRHRWIAVSRHDTAAALESSRSCMRAWSCPMGGSP